MATRMWQLPMGPMQNFVYLFADAAGVGFVVDPAFEPQAILAAAAEAGITLSHILVTHGHADHINAVADVRAACQARVVAHSSANHRYDQAVEDGAAFMVGAMRIRVLHTPGHRFDSVLYIVDDKWLITGDTLFVGECGRVDLPGASIDDMWTSLTQIIPKLGGELIVLPGHDYGATPTSTLAAEVATNYTLKPRDLPAFRAFMAAP